MSGRLWQSRMQREVKQLQGAPPPGVAAWPVDGALNHLHAQLEGPQNTVYAGGMFRVDVRIPERCANRRTPLAPSPLAKPKTLTEANGRYPMEPPKVRFVTPVYHPNIDSGGRICLDILNMPPKGGWTPRLEVPTVLASIRVLLAEPNPDDGLVADIVRSQLPGAPPCKLATC
jgi:ubiquitin-conjugating enzyme E2 T